MRFKAIVMQFMLPVLALSSCQSDFYTLRVYMAPGGEGERKLSEFLYIEKPKNGILIIEFVFKILSKPL